MTGRAVRADQARRVGPVSIYDRIRPVLASAGPRGMTAAEVAVALPMLTPRQVACALSNGTGKHFRVAQGGTGRYGRGYALQEPGAQGASGGVGKGAAGVAGSGGSGGPERRLRGPDRIPTMLHPDEPPFAGFEARRAELRDLRKAERLWRERLGGARYEDVR